MLVIGLTGGIGSGKSAISARFEALGVPCIDADRLTRELVAPGTPLLDTIVTAFGAEVLLDNGTLDRGALRTRIFADPAARQRLEALMHPAVRAETDRRLAALDAPYCVLVVPLLVETGGADRVHRVLVVDADEATQTRRTMTRDGVNAEHVEAIMKSQASRAERLRSADDVIDNSADIHALDAVVLRLHERYLGLAAAHEWPLPPTRAVTGAGGRESC